MSPALLPLSLALAACGLSRAAVVAPPTLDVMAYNVLFKGADDAKSLAAIKDENPDVLCITELTQTFIDRFDKKFPGEYPYRKLIPKPGATGVGVYSKYPLTRAESFPIPPFNRATLHVTIDAPREPLDAICVHLTPPKVDGYKVKDWNDAIRTKEGAALVKRIGKRPTLVLGDFNENLGGPALTALRGAGFSPACDTANETRCTATFPGPVVPWPAVFTIDHIIGKDVKFTSARTVRAGGSDHYPVTASLR